MDHKTRIHLNKFTPRSYQIPILDAIENKGYKRVLAILPRRAGKDYAAWWLCIRECIRKTQVIYYLFPTYAQAKKALWNAVSISGLRFLDLIPSDLIESLNSQEMIVKFKNGSIIQLVGSDNYNSLMGTNAHGMVFSEYALQDPLAWQYLRPILAASNGWALFISTPRGKNHLWELYQIALNSPNWFAYKMTLDETKHLSDEAILEERKEMSEDLFMQEYYCSFDLGVEGSIYGKYIDKMKLKGQIGMVPWESSFRVNTAWDIGRDTTSIIFYQSVGQVVRVIDYYEKANENLEYFVKHLEVKPYIYNKHFFPHDMRVTEWGGPKFTRVEKARQLGLKVTIVDEVSLEDGIEYVRSSLSKIWIDEQKCTQLIKCLENYRYEYDSKKQVYKSVPLHNWASHGADSFRYMCLSLPKTRDGLSAEELDKRYRETVYGTDHMPGFFRTDL